MPHFEHVVVVLENKRAYSEVALSPRAPYLNGLAAAGVRLTNSYVISRHQESTYLALFSGSTVGATDRSCSPSTRPTLAGELRAAGGSFAVYAEPSAGNLGGCANPPCTHHDAPPAGVAPGASINRPFSAFPQDFAKLPTVSFVIPGLSHDMGDGSIAEGDTWLSKNLRGYAQWSVRHHSLLIVTFLTGNSLSKHVLTVLSGADLVPGTDGAAITPYSLMRTIEDAYRLRPLGRSAGARPITADWQL